MHSKGAVAALFLGVTAALFIGDSASGGSAAQTFIVTGHLGGAGGKCALRAEQQAVECTRGSQGPQGSFLGASLPAGGEMGVATKQQTGTALVRYGTAIGVGTQLVAASTTTRTVNYNGWEYVETTVSW